MYKLLLKHKGFTLIELLIVIVIIGILSVGFAPTLLNAPKKARDGVRKGNLEQIRKAIDAYALDNGSKYPEDHSAEGSYNCFKKSDLALNASKYFQGGTLPIDPSGPDYVVYGGQCQGDFLYRKNGDTSGCYILATKVEIDSNGNSSRAISHPAFADCDTAVGLTAGTAGTWFYKVVKF